ncbi:MAG: HigA family addiction module antidote protein [Armatimonadetes bacterium]|nr:HigA family addiction module antidote protein [Armatimonadota bacterium]
MTDIIESRYRPDDVSPPGETLQETLEAFGWTQAELAERMNRPPKTINEIIKGRAGITPETALQLERVLGISAAFWNNREANYRDWIARSAERRRLGGASRWVARFPVNAMIRFGWLEKKESQIEMARELLGFFGVASPTAWTDWFSSLCAAYRQSKAFPVDKYAVAAWLRKGETEAQGIDCSAFHKARFRAALSEIRSLTSELPEVLEPELRRLCAEAGVAQLFVRDLPGTRISGAARWLNPRKALIQMTLRYKTNDHLWFTFFHEAGHILLHGKTDVFVDFEDERQNAQEDEANRFAANFLVPPDAYNQFVDCGDFRCVAIEAFATEVSISPGIVVGRLQHDRRIAYNRCNHLKVRFRWTDGRL